jgi:hypothetical protein
MYSMQTRKSLDYFGRKCGKTYGPNRYGYCVKTRSEDFKVKKKAVFNGSHKPLDWIRGNLVKRRIPSNHPNSTKLPRNSTPSWKSSQRYRLSTTKLSKQIAILRISTFMLVNWNPISNGCPSSLPRRARQSLLSLRFYHKFIIELILMYDL